MAVLQRSVTSFRRQGSSGLVWDDKLLAGVLYQIKPGEDGANNAVASDRVRLGQSNGMMERSGSFVVVVEPVYRTKVGEALSKQGAADDHPPLSQKVRGCGLWGVFRKSRVSARRVGDQCKFDEIKDSLVLC